MCTFLGIAGKINENDIKIEAIKKSEIIFLEGYLWDEGEPKKAFDKAISNSNKTAMSLSDQFCVERHKKNFLNLVKEKLDLTFANEGEIMSLIDAKNFNEVITFAKQIKKHLIITRGDKGAISIINDEITEGKDYFTALHKACIWPMRTSSRSPLSIGATPLGVPVRIISPGRSVMFVETKLTSSAQEKII